MSGNTLGLLFTVTTFGESHGPAIGAVVDGCPPGIALDAAEIQAELDRRRPGQSRFTTQRREPDTVRILSGVFEDEAGRQVTTGTPIALQIDNVDQRSRDYGDIKDTFRPGHPDITYWQKYGIRDYRGGGRSSARETAMRVAAGAIARRILPGITVPGALVVNIGDLMEFWSGGRFVATSHRVRKVAEERYSFPLFFAADYDTVVAPLPRYVAGDAPQKQSLKAGEHLFAQTMQSFTYLKERRARGEITLPEGSAPLSSFGQEARQKY